MHVDPIRVLLVEDNPDDAVVISEMLTGSAEGEFQLTHFSLLADALTALAKDPFELFLVDLELPDSTGEQTLERIRQIHVPIIVITGSMREELALDLYLSGAHDYLIKGRIDGKVLSLAIRYAVERFRSLTAEQKQLSAIERLERANLNLKRVAEQDPLTGLLNRRGVENLLGIEASRSVRTGSDLAAVVFDYDDFKSVNDRHGHATGDRVLRALTRRMRTVCRPSDHLARIGGDEFLILLPETRVREAAHVAERMRDAISSAPLALGEDSIAVSASFAVTPVSPEQASVREILIATRKALHHGKSSGKNRVEAVTDPDPRSGDRGRGDRDATQPSPHEGLRVVRQPIYDLSTRRLRGFELLSRRGTDSSAASLFQQLGPQELAALDLECLRRCVAFSRSLPDGVRAHVNLFPSTIAAVGSGRILEVIQEEGGGPGSLCIEVNERQFLGDPSSLGQAVSELKLAGLEIAIDDVGFGRSVLETLILLEPDVIKVDRRYVHGVAEDIGKQRNLRRLLNVAASLDCQTIAEGIETAADLGAITDAGIRFGQGYLLGRPSENASGEWCVN